MKRLWLLLAIAASARLLMQIAAMPPYAGLDEAYHVARFAFVAQEHRNPAPGEKSIPPYLARSIDAQAGYPAAWPARGELTDRAIDEPRPYTAPNYEAQHPSLVYSIAAPLLRPRPSQLDELRRLRLFSIFFAFVVVIAVASIGARIAGAGGIVAAALLVAFPTWETLVARASNDAFACAAIAVAFAVSFREPKSRAGWVGEGAAWAVALAAKLYSWPASVGVFVLWIAQRAPWKRRVTVMACGALGMLLTVADLAMRTRNPLGLFMFDPGSSSRYDPSTIDWAEVAKITIASFAWTSGPHWDALRPAAIALYLGPLLLLLIAALLRVRAERRVVVACVAAAVAFAVAQVANVFAYARSATGDLPAGGKEGWYWYSLAPLAFGVVVALALKHLPRAAVIFAVIWIAAWDVLITEGALWQDYAGITSAAHGDWLFRWGGRVAPFTYSISHVAVGPLSGLTTELRVVFLIALACLTPMAIRSSSGGTRRRGAGG